ncbi:thioredoxin fold domain-containing protein [Acidithiobacillus ferrivorans]|nr:thioredoxin fold domain-containing protein [Acidithiobacillus ferrivorans]
MHISTVKRRGQIPAGKTLMRSRDGLWSRSALLSGLLALLLFLVPPLVAAAPNDAVQDAAPLLQRLDHAHWIAQGHGPHVLYVIFDPNCPYCHVLYDELQPRIQPDQLTVRYVPVGYLAPSSFGKAAAILEAKNPLAAIQKNEKGFNVTSHDGAIPEILPNTASTNALHSNMGILKATGQKIVPTLIYTRRDNTVKIIKGTPDQADLPAVLKEIR